MMDGLPAGPCQIARHPLLNRAAAQFQLSLAYCVTKRCAAIFLCHIAPERVQVVRSGWPRAVRVGMWKTLRSHRACE